MNVIPLTGWVKHRAEQFDGETVAVEMPVVACGASGPGHYPHPSSHVGSYRNGLYHGDWTWCPGTPHERKTKHDLHR